jgi:hypothetical protein
MYCAIQSSFQDDVFMNFQPLINYVHDRINLCRITYLNRRTNHLAFEFVGQHTWVTFLDQMRSSSFVTRHVLVELVTYVKKQCEKVMGQLMIKLQN